MNDDRINLMTFPPSTSDFVLSPEQAFDCIVAEFERANTSDARGMILEIFLKGMSLAEAQVEGQEKKEQYRTAIKQGYNLMIIKETAGADGLIDPKALLLVTSREVLAGRMMESDELRILALKGPEEERPQKPRWAFWRR